MKSKFLLMALILLVACQEQRDEEIQNSLNNSNSNSQTLDIKDWTDATHSNKVEPDYSTVLPQDKVNTLEIEMTGTDWKNIQSNMQTLYGFGFGSAGSQQPGGAFPDDEPDYVSVSMKFNNKEWYKVGFRLKGNSTLRNSWRNGIYKLPFRLNMDYYEDTYPQIKNQRFFGFKELSMSPGANDNSLIREKVGSDIFRMAGIPCAQTAFYKVFINFGDGLKYCGVYTMVEVVDDTMIKNQFGEESGNIYKPESRMQTFIQSEFEKKNNEAVADYSDVKTLIAALNSPVRASDAAAWRSELEKSLNVDHYMKWLAINTTMLNWDTYGRMAHNYYLYNLPGKGLTWIPWDNNEAMMNRGNNTYTISLSTTDTSWPLIRYMMDDPVYVSRYKFYVKEFVDNVFFSEKMNELFTRYHGMISPYVIGPENSETGKYTHLSGASAFTSALEQLKQHVASQRAAAATYLQ